MCVCWITTILVCMSRVGWNPSWFSDYRDYGSLSTGIWSLRWLFLYLRSYDLVGSVTIGAIFFLLHACSTGLTLGVLRLFKRLIPSFLHLLPCLLACLLKLPCLLVLSHVHLRHGLVFFSSSTSPYGAMGDPFPAFDLNVRIEQDDDGNLPFNLNGDHNNGIVSIVTQFALSIYDIHSSRLQMSFPFSVCCFLFQQELIWTCHLMNLVLLTSIMYKTSQVSHGYYLTWIWFDLVTWCN